MKKPSIVVPTSKHLDRMAELEQTVVEQDVSLMSVTNKLKMAAVELEQVKMAMDTQAKKHADEMSRLWGGGYWTWAAHFCWMITSHIFVCGSTQIAFELIEQILG